MLWFFANDDFHLSRLSLQTETFKLKMAEELRKVSQNWSCNSSSYCILKCQADRKDRMHALLIRAGIMWNGFHCYKKSWPNFFTLTEQVGSASWIFLFSVAHKMFTLIDENNLFIQVLLQLRTASDATNEDTWILAERKESRMKNDRGKNFIWGKNWYVLHVEEKF